MVLDFTTIALDRSVGEASLFLAQSGASYGIVVTANEEPVALITHDQLQVLPDQEASLTDALAILSPLLVVEHGQSMDNVVEHLSENLVMNRAIPGAVVRQAGKASGVVPRRTIAEHARRAGERGGDIKELPGAPSTPAFYFSCPKGDYVELVTDYDRENPPRCRVHNLVLIRKG